MAIVNPWGIPKSRRSRNLQKSLTMEEGLCLRSGIFTEHVGPYICPFMPLHGEFLLHEGHVSPVKYLSVLGAPQGHCDSKLYFCPPLQRTYFPITSSKWRMLILPASSAAGNSHIPSYTHPHFLSVQKDKSSHHLLLPLWCIGLGDHELNLQKPWAKISPFSFSFLYQSFCLSSKKSNIQLLVTGFKFCSHFIQKK